METKAIVGKALETVTFLFAAFSGLLKSIAPPEETSIKMTVGIASFATLIILLFISAIALGRVRARRRKFWLVAAALMFLVFLACAYQYSEDLSRLTFNWPPQETKQTLYVGGDNWLMPKAYTQKIKHPELTGTDLVSGFGGLERKAAVWPEEAIKRASRRLRLEYVVLVLSLATSIFCITEGVISRAKTKQNTPRS